MRVGGELQHAHVALDRRKERLKPFIRGSVRKVTGEYLGRGVGTCCHVRDERRRTLKPGVSSTTDSCAAAGTPFSVTGAAGAASDILEGWTGGFFVRMNLMNRFLRVKLGGWEERAGAGGWLVLIRQQTPLIAYYVAMAAAHQPLARAMHNTLQIYHHVVARRRQALQLAIASALRLRPSSLNTAARTSILQALQR